LSKVESLSGGGVAKRPKPDPEREERIAMEVVVDAYGEEERAMGWYYYLEDKLRFPFTAICVAKRAVSPLRVGEEVKVIGMAPETECGNQMFVTIPWEEDSLAVPLAQLNPVLKTAKATKQAVEDWHYWIRMGYEL
jgi:hypothetical protein